MSKLVSENDIKDETWLTLPGEAKISEQPDAHWNSASMFTLMKEDHTMANLLRMKLHTNKLVRFAGYKIPHPTVSNVELTVQTAPIHVTSSAGANGDASEGSVLDPGAAVLQAIDEVIADIDMFGTLWARDVAPKTIDLLRQQDERNAKRSAAQELMADE